MLSAEAARLAAIEVLSPTAAHVADAAFPTLAEGRIYDSRAAAVHDIDEALRQDGPGWLPVVSVFARGATAAKRGEAAALDDTDGKFELEFVAELATIVTEEGETYVDAVVGDDPSARLVLAALCAQIRRLLLHAEEGWFFRKLIRSVESIAWEPYAVPELGLRWQRTTMRMTCAARDDSLSDAGGLPAPISTLAAGLPEGSYAKAKLAELASHFAAIERTPLAGVTFTNTAPPPSTHGFDFETSEEPGQED